MVTTMQKCKVQNVTGHNSFSKPSQLNPNKLSKNTNPICSELIRVSVAILEGQEQNLAHDLIRITDHEISDFSS